CRPARAVPEVILVSPPQLARQHAALVPADLREVAQVVPLTEDQVGLERAGVMDEDVVERLLARDLRPAQHLPSKRARLLRVVPADDLGKPVLFYVINLKLFF